MSEPQISQPMVADPAAPAWLHTGTVWPRRSAPTVQIPEPRMSQSSQAVFWTRIANLSEHSNRNQEVQIFEINYNFQRIKQLLFAFMYVLEISSI